jgi:hypothetical protein
MMDANSARKVGIKQLRIHLFYATNPNLVLRMDASVS